MRPRSLPRGQRGVALIIALVLVALATILAWKISFEGYLERRRSFGMLAAEQAMQFSLGAEALAADVLAQQAQKGSQQYTLADAWAQPTQPLPITSPNDPEGPPIGTLQGSLEDLQGRFNLNNLKRSTADGKPDPQPLKLFQRLLVSVGLEPKWAQVARDWIDADNEALAEGAEDSVYTAQTPPYLTGNWPMTSTSELLALPGFGLDRFRKLEPYVTALPIMDAKVNLCTASAYVIESLADGLNGEYSSNKDALILGRKTGCFPDKNTFMNLLGGAGSARNKLIDGTYADTTAYFLLTTHVTLGTTEFTLYSLLMRNPGGKLTPLLRTFGTQ